MINKELDDLSIGEQLKIQGIIKKKQKGMELNESEAALYNRFHEEFTAAERNAAKFRTPVLIVIAVSILLAIARKFIT